MTISDPAPAVPERIDDDTLARVVRDVGQVRAELRRVYQGPSSVIDALLVGLVARGHILLEGVPGVAKTTLALRLRKVFSHSRSCAAKSGLSRTSQPSSMMMSVGEPSSRPSIRWNR